MPATDPVHNAPPSIVRRSTRLSVPQAVAVAREKLMWGRRMATWDDHGSAGLGPVVAAVLATCGRRPGVTAVDLGCGSGQVTIPLARRCDRVVGVDVSPAAIELLTEKTRMEGVANVDGLAQPVETLQLAPGTVDLIVSNYALHHLRDADKHALLRRARTWLRPGGRLVIGDMMFGRGAQPADRPIIARKVRSLAARGPAGWWRIAKNAVRFGLRLGEKPWPAERWEAAVAGSGFDEVSTARIVSEACVLSATKPSHPETTTVPPEPTAI